MANKKRTTGITAQMVREARGIRTQATCAELIGVTTRQLHKYENGDVEIKLENYKILCEKKS
jgi:DNA-binding XRE family transcriptional regulator